jgi:CRP-like cAMP-binding protein
MYPGICARAFVASHGVFLLVYVQVQFFGDKRRDNIFWHFVMESSQVVIHGDGDVVCAKGELESALCVIKSGQVKEVNEAGKAIRAMKRPCHWGEGALLKAVANSLRYTQNNVVAKGIVEVFMIDSLDLEELVSRDAEVNKLCMDFIHDEMQRYMSLKYNAISKRLCAWAVEKAQIEFRAFNMARDDLRPRAYGRLR